MNYSYCETNDKIGSLFSNTSNDIGPASTWSMFNNNNNNESGNLLLSPEHLNTAPIGGKHLLETENDELTVFNAHHPNGVHKNNLISLSAGSTKSSSASSKSSKTSHSLTNLSHFPNGPTSVDADQYGPSATFSMEQYTLQQQQSKILASAATSTGLTSGTPQLIRTKMIYHCKFGKFGINDGQFTEPSGVTINTNNDIIVADTNSHRIQIFDKDGRFKFKFGECGKLDGQLLYPNRVSIVKQTGDIVVTER